MPEFELPTSFINLRASVMMLKGTTHSLSLTSPYPGSSVMRVPVADDQISWNVSIKILHYILHYGGRGSSPLK